MAKFYSGQSTHTYSSWCCFIYIILYNTTEKWYWYVAQTKQAHSFFQLEQLTHNRIDLWKCIIIGFVCVDRLFVVCIHIAEQVHVMSNVNTKTSVNMNILATHCKAEALTQDESSNDLNNTQIILIAVVASVFAVLVIAGAGFFIKARWRIVLSKFFRRRCDINVLIVTMALSPQIVSYVLLFKQSNRLYRLLSLSALCACSYSQDLFNNIKKIISIVHTPLLLTNIYNIKEYWYSVFSDKQMMLMMSLKKSLVLYWL